MRKLIAFITSSILLLALACSDEPSQVKYNENDLSVLREIYADMGVKWPEYPCDFDNPQMMCDVVWENIGGEYRVVEFKSLSHWPFYRVKTKPHELTSRIGELTQLRFLRYGVDSLKGIIPSEIFNCPLETLKLAANSEVSCSLFPGIFKVANTLRTIDIRGVNLGIDGKELEQIFDLPKLDYILFDATRLTGHISARYGEQNYSTFQLCYNNFTSCDPKIFLTDGEIFPNLMWNNIYCEVPYICQTKRWKENQNRIDLYDLSYNRDRGVGFREMPKQ